MPWHVLAVGPSLYLLVGYLAELSIGYDTFTLQSSINIRRTMTSRLLLNGYSYTLLCNVVPLCVVCTSRSN